MRPVSPQPLSIRVAVPAQDCDQILDILGPVIAAGATYAFPNGADREQIRVWWFDPGHEVFVAETGDQIVGTYFLKANQSGHGDHVANCGYVTDSTAAGRGVASAMCRHSLRRARDRGFAAMQFNLVVGTNQRAVALWRRMGFDIVGTIPQGFRDPEVGPVDCFVMYRTL